MTLRARLLLAIFAVNLVVLGTLSALLYAQNLRLLQGAADRFHRTQWPPLLKKFSEELPGKELSIVAMLEFGGFDAFRDVLLADFRLVSNPEVVGASEARYANLQINPLGALHRDHANFPRDEILSGIRRAMDERDAVSSAGGFCLPLYGPGDELIGGGWFLPHGAVPIDPLPIQTLVIAVGLGVLLLGGITLIGIERWVIRPVAQLSRAAQELEQGGAAQLPEQQGAPPEFDRVFAAFQHASVLIREHRRELEKAIDAATKRAQRRERELVLSQRLAAIGTLAAGIAHEINNPLAGLMNALRRLRKTDDPEREELYVSMIEDGLDRIRNIVTRTLDFAPRSAGVESFDLTNAVRRAEQLVAHRMAVAGVTFELLEEPTAVRGDAHEMTQVFLNLFLNSMDALEESATPDPRIQVDIGRVREEDEELVDVHVRDNGPGVSQEVLDRIFDPFFSTKGATATSEKLSSGLGMSISYTIVEQHGGSMSVRSEPGRGFEVCIRLPLPSESGEPGAAYGTSG